MFYLFTIYLMTVKISLENYSECCKTFGEGGGAAGSGAPFSGTSKTT
jgi:hypothetical protein